MFANKLQLCSRVAQTKLPSSGEWMSDWEFVSVYLEVKGKAKI